LTHKERAETRYSKLKLVVAYIEKHFKVGTVNQPSSYFKGTLPMQWGKLEHSETIYFTGSTQLVQQTILGLGGSTRHVISSTGDLLTQSGESRISPSVPPVLLDALIREIASSSHEGSLPLVSESAPPSNHGLAPSAGVPGSAALQVVADMANNMKGPQENFEFFARTLLQDQVAHPHLLLGTPLYVAYAV
jgi:hypothetical protein